MTGGTRRGAGAVGADFFISHAGRDRAWAEWVAWHLLEAGYTVELDCWDWAVGENFLTKMHHALNTANRVVALFSPAYFEDIRYTTGEWTSALIKNDDGGHRLLPIQVEPCAVPRCWVRWYASNSSMQTNPKRRDDCSPQRGARHARTANRRFPATAKWGRLACSASSTRR